MSYDIESLKRKLLIKYPFFGSVLANVYYKEDDHIDTACTDGKAIYYNSEFLNTLSVNGQLFVLAHEVCHVAFNHILRSEGKNPRLWNIATDGVINQLLQNDGLNIIENAINIPEALHLDAEELYEKLLKEQKDNPEQNGNNGNDSNNSEEKDVGHDSHSMWKKVVENHKNNNSNGESSAVEEKQEEYAKMGENKAFEKNKEEKKKMLDDLKKELSEEASKEVSKSLGSGLSSMGAIRSLSNIGRSKQIIDWRYILREAIKYDVDWSYENATIEEGVVTPHLEEMPKAETEIVLDTSGSVDENLLKNFLRECKNILPHSELKVGCFDTKFYGFENIRTEYDIDNMKFQGGGGTDFNVAVDAFSGRVENKIIFTDGMSSPPIKEMDAIWLIYGGYHLEPRGGRVINISDEQMRKLQRLEQDKGFSKTLKR